MTSDHPVGGKQSRALKTFRCHLRRDGIPVKLDCLAPSMEAAAFVAARAAGVVTGWTQVEVREWIPLLREHMPGKLVTVDPELAPPPDAERALIIGSPELP